MRKCLSIVVLLTALSFSVFAQSAAEGPVDQSFLNDYVSRRWTTADGLPGMTITSLIQDQKGYIYMGTYDGLVRFDGVEFVTLTKTFNPKYDFVSVRSIYEDEKGNLWVGHNDEGVSCISPDGSIVRYTTADGLPHNSVRAICEDKEGNIWLGTASGLCYLTSGREVVFPNGLKELGQEMIQVTKLYCDTAGRVWVSTAAENDLFVYSDKMLMRFMGITKIKNARVNEVTQDRSGALWFGIAPHYAIRIKETEETLFDLSHDHLEGTVVNAIVQDSVGNYWFASDSGLTVVHNGKYTYYDKRNGLPDDYINNLIEDREGNIWIAYNRGGIEKMSHGKFRTVPMSTTVNAIAIDSQNNLTWMGTDSGLYCYQDGKFLENKITELCQGMRVRHVEMTKDNELLISTYSDASQIRVKPNGQVRVWTIDDGLPGLKCRVGIKTSTGDYYIGTTKGLSVVDHVTDKITSYTRKDGLENEYIMCIYEDTAGRIWVGTDGGGIYIFQNGKIIKHYDSKSGLAGNVIFKIATIKNNDIWITTGTGISKYIESTDSFCNFNSSNGLGTDSIFQMICDYTHTVWMTSNKGILSVPLQDFEDVVSGKATHISAKYFGDSDGLITEGITSTSVSTTDVLGRVWFTLIDGVAIYDPIRSIKNQVAPTIEIQEYSIDNVSYEYHGERIVIPPYAKRLSIKFTGLSFISSENMKFSFKLGGFEKDYSQWGSLRTVSYTNLGPGTYQFTIKAQNSDGVESEPSLPITIIKQPYVWQLAWFWIIIATLVVGVIVLAIWMKLNRMRRYQIALEQKVRERTHDLKLEKEKSEQLLLNILPREVAKELSENPDHVIAKKYPNVTVLFTDIVGFTKLSDGMSAEEVVTMLNAMVSRFDERAMREGIEKIKTIGDAYMAATGLTEDENNDGAIKMVRYALGLLDDVREFNEKSAVKVHIRIGINTGNLVAGVIGKSKFIYDIWGDTVNVASRMESTGVPMKIHVTETTYSQTKDSFNYSSDVEIEVKGKGEMRTYFL